MRTKLLIPMVLLVIMPLFSQKLKEAQLPKPNQLSLNYLNSLGQCNILYGQVPPNFNGDVIIFNHGYIGSTESMLIGNEMYELAYNAGYKTAFVATTRGEGLWVNGEVLGRAIDQITGHYNVQDAFLVVHSNGGKASEAALFRENKRNKIKRVISLGTPFHGTQLADLSQNWWFKWLWSLTGLNDGAALSTTYYCESVVRPYFDNHPLNQPDKYYNLGTWGWNKGHTLLKPTFVTAGAYIELDGGGDNDGVTPYYSSIRPNGNIILANDGSKNGHYDHLDILYGQYSWKYIQPFLEEDNQSNRKSIQEKEKVTTNYEVVSDYQIVYSQNEYDEIILQDRDNVEITIFHENPQAYFSTGENNNRSARVNDYTTQISVDKLKTYNLKIESDSKYVAFVKEPQKTSISYNFEKGEKYPILSLNVLNEAQEKNTQVSAIITKTTDLYGKPVRKPQSEVVNFKWNESKGEFQLKTNRFSEGVYSLYLTAQSEKQFKRNIASGFTVGKIPVDIKKLQKIDPQEKLATLVQDSYSDTQIIVKNSLENTKMNILIYDLNGRLILNKLVQVKENRILIRKELQSFSKGIYLIKINTKEGNETLKFIKK